MKKVKRVSLPADHPSNRLGELIFQRDGIGEIRKCRLGYFVWPEDERRGFQFQTEAEAMERLGLKRRLGYDDDGLGTNRIGKLIERNQNGDILKHNDFYYVWPAGEDECTLHVNLVAARSKLGIVHSGKGERTLPKLEYPQNRKGYRADIAGRK